MKKIKLVLFSILTAYSCKKDFGCTDAQALNYNPQAEVNDASCLYPQTNTFVDERDGTTYHTLALAGHTWIRENIRYKLDSAKVPNGATELKQQEGYLYTFEIAKSVCPSGFHLSTKKEWDDVMGLLDSNALLVQTPQQLIDTVFPGAFLLNNQQYIFYNSIAKYIVFDTETAFFDISISKNDSLFAVSGPFQNDIMQLSVKCVKDY